jgi:hypothetical protein
MNLLTFRTSLTVALLFTAVGSAAANPAGGPSTLVVDCNTRALPSQAAIGDMLDQRNFSEAYNARPRLMAEVNRACHREGITGVRLVLNAPRSGSRIDQRKLAREDSVRASKPL